VDVTAATGEDQLRVVIHDDGRGGVDLTKGSGLVGFNDRVEALDGRLTVSSPSGRGTTAEAVLPVPDLRLGGAPPATSLVTRSDKPGVSPNGSERGRTPDQTARPS
jgi:hypothetical protein